MSPFILDIWNLLSEIKASVVNYIRAYFSGNSTTGAYSKLSEYIGSTSGSTVQTIKAGMLDIATSFNIEGSPSIGYFTAPLLTIAAGTTVLAVDLVGGTTQPTATLGGVALNLTYTPLRIDTTGTVKHWRGHCTINGAPATDETLTMTNTTSTVVLFIQDQSTTAPGVS